MPPPRPRAAATAAAASVAAERALDVDLNQWETGRATDAMSVASGAPSGRCARAWSPTRFTSGVRAL